MVDEMLAAWRLRGAVRDQAAGSIVVDLRGGRGALLRRVDASRLISIVSAEDAANPSAGLRGWLERRQAKRSAVLVVPDRKAGVTVALRWRLDPQRFRLAGAFDLSADGHPATAPWHSVG